MNNETLMLITFFSPKDGIYFYLFGSIKYNGNKYYLVLFFY